jgi:hypothetical protein
MNMVPGLPKNGVSKSSRNLPAGLQLQQRNSRNTIVSCSDPAEKRRPNRFLLEKAVHRWLLRIWARGRLAPWRGDPPNRMHRRNSSR